MAAPSHASAHSRKEARPRSAHQARTSESTGTADSGAPRRTSIRPSTAPKIALSPTRHPCRAETSRAERISSSARSPFPSSRQSSASACSQNSMNRELLMAVGTVSSTSRAAGASPRARSTLTLWTWATAAVGPAAAAATSARVPAAPRRPWK